MILLDPSPLQTDPVDAQFDVLLRELESHDPALAARPRIVALSKVDVLDADSDALEFDVPVMRISAVTGDGLDDLMYAVADMVDTIEREAPEREGFVLHRPLTDDFTIRRESAEWVVEGIAAIRATNLSDLTDPDAAEFVSRRLVRSGIVDGLRDAGAEPGDDVRIGSIVFTFDPDLDDPEEAYP